jgi:predicted ATPase
VAPETAKRLYEETEGVPFFLVEYLLALSKGGVAAEERGWPVPGGIRELLRARLSAVGDTGMQVLTAAAVIGRWFDFETVREVSGRSEEEAVSALEDLLAQGLIRELHGTAAFLPTYDFSHEKLRSLVYEEMSQARRRLLHRRVAESLAGALRRRRDSSGILGQIAHHYLMAGDQSAAADYYKQAGERARKLYANAEALAHLRTALALGSPAAAELHEAIGDLYTILGEYVLALTSYEAAATMAEPEASARLEHKQGNVYARRGEWGQAEHHLEAALTALDRFEASSSQSERARIYADWSLAAHHLGRLDQAWRLAQQARELAEDAANTEGRRALAQAHNILGVLASSRGDVDDAITHLERSLSLAEDADDTSARAAALNNLALALASCGDVELAIARAEAALALSTAQGDRHHEAALHNNLADLLHAAGRPEDAMTHLKQAVSIYAEIGVEAGAVQPGIWKLTAW